MAHNEESDDINFQKELKAGLEKAGYFIATAISKPLQIGSDILANELRYFRLKRILDLQEKVERLLHNKKGGKSRPASPRLLIPLLEKAGIEDDDYLHDFYARLLVSALDSNCPHPHPAFIDIIHGLSAKDAVVLESIPNVVRGFKELCGREQEEGFAFWAIPTDAIFDALISKEVEKLQLTKLDMDLSVNNLCRLECLGSEPEIRGEKSIEECKDSGTPFLLTYNIVYLTPLGEEFLRTCGSASLE